MDGPQNEKQQQQLSIVEQHFRLFRVAAFHAVVLEVYIIILYIRTPRIVHRYDVDIAITIIAV